MEESKYLTISEYASMTGKSKQWINSLTQKAKIDFKIIDGVKHIKVDPDDLHTYEKNQGNNKQSDQVVDPELINYFKQKIEKLEETINQKDQEIQNLNDKLVSKIESVQAKKDQQLSEYMKMLQSQTVDMIEHFQSKSVMTNESPITPQEEDHHDDSVIDVEPDHNPIYDSKEIDPSWISLNKHLKDKKFKKEYRIKVMKNAQKLLLEDSQRFMIKDKKIYIDPLTYSYKDLF